MRRATTCVRPLEARGAEIEVADAGALRTALGRLAARNRIAVARRRGGAARGGVEEGVVDAGAVVRDAERAGDQGVALLPGQQFSVADLRERRVEPLGPDVLIEGYVHRSR